MNLLIITLIAISTGLVLSWVSLIIISRIVKKHLPTKEILCAEGIETINELVKVARKKALDKKQTEQLWSNMMNYMMTTPSEKAAKLYLESINKRLNAEDKFANSNFFHEIASVLNHSENIIKERFGDSKRTLIQK